jgi:hypothetical protein
MASGSGKRERLSATREIFRRWRSCSTSQGGGHILHPAILVRSSPQMPSLLFPRRVVALEGQFIRCCVGTYQTCCAQSTINRDENPASNRGKIVDVIYDIRKHSHLNALLGGTCFKWRTSGETLLKCPQTTQRYSLSVVGNNTQRLNCLKRKLILFDLDRLNHRDWFRNTNKLGVEWFWWRYGFADKSRRVPRTKFIRGSHVLSRDGSLQPPSTTPQPTFSDITQEDGICLQTR